jgi:cob(I)alamin adenosyltransferase
VKVALSCNESSKCRRGSIPLLNEGGRKPKPSAFLFGIWLFVHLARSFPSAYNYKFGLMSDLRRGLIIVNTGPGKGKTTAAMGTALRAVGQGMRVLMLQFLKGSWHYGELDAVKAFGDKFILKQMGRGFVKVGAEKPDPEDVRMVEEAWAEAEKAIQSGEWDLVVLDEINYAISYGMLDPAKVVESLTRKPEMVHVILTGRNAHPTIVELADTVTEMRQVKHAYEKGVMAQRGIEY